MSKFLDIFLLSLTSQCLSFCWVRYVTHNNTISFWLSLVMALSVAYILYYYTTLAKAKHRKKVTKKQLENLFATLNYCEDLSSIFAPMLSYFHYQVVKIDYDHLLATRDNKVHFVVLSFDSKSLSASQMRSAIIAAKRKKATDLLIFSYSTTGSILANANHHLPTKIVDILGTYNLLKQSGNMPLTTQVKAFNAPIIAQIALTKKRAKLWTASSIGAILLSFVSYIDWWLLSWATIFALLAIYCLVNKKYNNTTTIPTI